MYLTRGQPVVYYGDEQGFIGDGGDKDARQDMFPSQVASYNDDDLIGTDATTAEANFDTDHPLYRHLADLADAAGGAPGAGRRRPDPPLRQRQRRRLRVQPHRRRRPARVRRRAQQQRDGPDGHVRHVQRARPVPRSVAGRHRRHPQRRRGSCHGHRAAAVSAVVWRADVGPEARSGTRRRCTSARRAPAARSAAGPRSASRCPTAASTRSRSPGGRSGTDDWTALGTDDNAPYRVFHDVTGLAKGTLVEYRAVLRDHSGNLSVAQTYATVGDPPPPGGGGAAAADRSTQPDAVSVPGTRNNEMGCPGDWQPECDQAQLTLDPDDQVWKGTYDLPAGDYEYKAAIDRSWDENYGAGGVPRRRRHPARRSRRTGDLLLRPRHALGHQRRPGTDRHRAGQLPVRARVPGRLAARLHAVVAAGPRRRRHVDVVDDGDPRRLLRGQGRPTACPGTRTTAPAACPAAPTSPSPSRPASGDVQLRAGHARADRDDVAGRAAARPRPCRRRTGCERGLVAWDLPADASGWRFRLHAAPTAGWPSTTRRSSAARRSR